MHIFTFEILEIELKCKFKKKICKNSLGIASKLKENDSEEGKKTKISAWGGLGRKKRVLKPLIFDFGSKKIHSRKSKKIHCSALIRLGFSGAVHGGSTNFPKMLLMFHLRSKIS